MLDMEPHRRAIVFFENRALPRQTLTEQTASTGRTTSRLHPIAHSILMGLSIFSLCLLSLITHPHFDLSTLWLANAFMLGMLVRFPSLATWGTWLCATMGFMLSDMLIGTDLLANIILNIGNLVSVAAGYWCLASLPRQDQMLKRPQSILYFFRAILVASCAAGLMGAIINPVLFGTASFRGFVFWAAAEIINYTALLPILLTLPSLRKTDHIRMKRWAQGITLQRFTPFAALVISAFAGVMIGGPGAIAFPVPALLWCALTYKLFTTSFISFIFATWTLLAIRSELLSVGFSLEESRSMLISTRLGVTLIALTPLVVASVMAAQEELLERLRLQADRDVMTGLRNRRAFFEDGAAILFTPFGTDTGTTTTVMMLDIDHFKKINDTYGHSAGDLVLVAFAEIVQQNVRPQDMIGRIGGEEFAIILPDCGPKLAVDIADRINWMLRGTSLKLDDGRFVSATVSIGVHVEKGQRELDHWLGHADKALYHAKNAGRNRWELSPASRTLALAS
ncbi:MAG: sensor domain-containing diguanylate cyclase [Sphingobium sp.]|nr:sensor domain-containing diguanylate cyclase [Sphingobium sp.]